MSDKQLPDYIEGNKLIAEFMGYKYFQSPYDGWGFCKDEKDMSTWLRSNNILYHSSWDWLMSVVEKIEQNYTPVEILDLQCTIGRTIYNPDNIQVCSNNSKLDATWQAVIQFIQWYNSQVKL
jgi:hypothetical protein